MLSLSQTILYYKRLEIQQAIVDAAEDREVAVKYSDKGFGKRPDVLKYPRDLLELALKGASSFHVSEEVWNNPLELSSSMNEKEKNELRKGWDLVIDIDCHVIEYSKFAAYLIVEALKYHGVTSITCKFSGNKGFHIGVPFEAFPEKIHGTDTRLLFPEAPKKIALYIKHMINEKLGKMIFDYEQGDFSSIKEKTGFDEEEIKITEDDEFGIPREHLDASKIADIDTLLISSRHLYRMPYSFNEKSGLVSIPININSILEFDKYLAKPENVKVDEKLKFLNKDFVRTNEAAELILQAYDYKSAEEVREKNKEDYEKSYSSTNKKEFSEPEMAIDEKYFPPCILKAFNGINDGKKRALFAMMNFLRCMAWDKDEIDKRLHEWNEKNPEPLREGTLKGQIRYSFMKKDNILPPNCKEYYEGIGICNPDNLCQKIKNPVNYSLRKSRYASQITNSEKKEKKSQNNDDNVVKKQ
jgi:DNA primase catalytic subunit